MPAATPAMRAGQVLRWLRREGDEVLAGEPLVEIAADRLTMEVETPESGVLARILVAEGAENIAVGAPLCLIAPGRAPHRKASAAQLDSSGGREGRAPVSPRAARLARDHGVDLSAIEGSGPEGRVIARDIFAALAGPARVETRPGFPPLFAALHASPQVCLEVDCDLGALDRRRAEKPEAGVTLTDCALRALALALQAVPAAHRAYGAQDFVAAAGSDIGLALTLGGRALAPALRNVERMSLAEIAAARRAIVDNPPSEREAFGGSALLVNAGPFAVKRLFPPLSAPWTAILAMGAAETRVVWRDGAATPARMVSVTLTVDRRAMEAADAAQALGLFKTLMENPQRLELAVRALRWKRN